MFINPVSNDVFVILLAVLVKMWIDFVMVFHATFII